MLDWSKIKPYPYSAGHRGDECSKEAARKINPKLKDRQKAVLDALTATKGGGTVDDIAQVLSMHRDALKPRFTELKLMGLIRKTGRKGKTELGGSCAIWEITPCNLTEKGDN